VVVSPDGRIVVLGVGGVGGYFGGKLVRGGEPVTFVARGAHLQALRTHGLRVRSAIEGESVVTVDAVERPAGPPASAVIVSVKSFDTEAALLLARPVIGPATAVVSLQNGVDNLETIDRVLGPAHAIGGVAYVFASIEAPGVIAHQLNGTVALGERDGTMTPRLARLEAAFQRAGVPVSVTTEIVRVLWEKYLLICAQAGLTALTRCPIGVIRETPETWRLYRTVVEELAAVGTAAGVRLPADVVDRIVGAAAGLGAGARSSMYHDLVAGKRLELEGLHGHAVRLGEKLGVPTPVLAAIYAGLKPHVAGARP
jgi:2-dehydropantoate 2-reductase